MMGSEIVSLEDATLVLNLMVQLTSLFEDLDEIQANDE